MSFPPSIGVKIMTSLGLHAHPVSSLLLPTVPCYAGPAIIVNFLINQGLRIRTSLAEKGASKELKGKDLRETGRLEVVLQSLGGTFPLFASSMIFALLTNLPATEINLCALTYTLSQAGYHYSRNRKPSSRSEMADRRGDWDFANGAFWVLGCGSCLRLLWVGGRRI